MTATMTLNNNLNGVELSFPGKPAADILDTLKASGFRWHNAKKVWYARQNEKTLTVAESISAGEAKPAAITDGAAKADQKQNTNKKEVAPLFERVQIAEDINNSDNAHGGKEIASIVRKHIRERFPECKFSVTSDYNSVNITLKSSPYEHKTLDYSPEIENQEYRRFERENNKEINAIINYCEKYVKSYQYCTNYDPYGDYGSSYNIYAHVRLDYDYTQMEQTEADIMTVSAFRASLEAQEDAEAIEQEKRIAEAIKEREASNAAAEVRRAQEEKDHAYIMDNVKSVDIAEDEQYIIYGAQMADCNKMQYLDEYKKQIESNEFYLKDVKITREIHFKNADALNLFSGMLLRDFSFLAETGGSYTDDPRVNSMTDYNNMSKDERETVKFNLYGIAVYLGGVMQFIIDTQGYSYARYVGLVDGAERGEITPASTYTEDIEAIEDAQQTARAIEDTSTDIITNLDIHDEAWKSSADYKTQMKAHCKTINGGLTKAIIQQVEIEKLKIYLYSLLVEIDGVQEKFADSGLEEGMRFTVFSIGSMGMVSTTRATFHKAEPTSYAQYADAVKLTMTPQKKRSQYYTYYHSGQCFVLVEGWQEIPDSILWETSISAGGLTTRASKYSSCDHRQIIDIKNYMMAQNVKILVDRSEN